MCRLPVQTQITVLTVKSADKTKQQRDFNWPGS